MTLLQIEDLRVTFPTPDGPVHALRGVSLEVSPGQALGIVGETGCGKSALALAVLGLLSGARVQGRVAFDGVDLIGLSRRRWEDIRGRHIGMVFQDPFTALNPVFTIADQIGTVIRRHFKLTGKALTSQSLDWLQRVGLPDPPAVMHRYPHQLSGGMRQRVAIALALAGKPSLLLADEPTTALDVTVQAQVLDLLKRLQAETGVAVVLISHDLGVVAQICRRMAVMYAGRVVEEGTTSALFDAPAHPYTRGLFEALPGQKGHRPDAPPGAVDRQSTGKRLRAIPGTVPSPHAFPTGCPFHPRCERVEARCREEVPPLSSGVACYFPYKP